MDPEKPKIQHTPLIHPEHDVIHREGPPIRIETGDAGKPDEGRVAEQPAKHTLTDLSREFEFFTPAVIRLAGRFDRDPVLEFMKSSPGKTPEELPFIIDSPQPLFEGLGTDQLPGITGVFSPVDWNRRLYAIHRDQWHFCLNFIGGIAMADPRDGFQARVGYYEIPLVDPGASSSQVTITVFGISSTEGTAYLQPRGQHKRPIFVRRPRQTFQLDGSPPDPNDIAGFLE